MQASLGRKGDYSVRAVLDLARHHGDRRKAREIAGEMDIPLRYLTPSILRQACRACFSGTPLDFIHANTTRYSFEHCR